MSATKELFNAIASRDDASEGASGGGGVEAIRAMLADNPVLATTANDQGISPVMFALYCQKREVATLFLDAGAVPGIFETAALGELEELTSCLDADSGGDATALTARSPDGFTLLHLACFFGHL